jgi:high-affinity nickel-transport protein
MTGLLAILSVGFFLGMRHATDPDHVIAVSTIVARQRSTGGAAAIGAVWGLGHTLTILVVGTGIIVFGWVIPPRVGLSMEWSVGIMLVLLGFMNLRSIVPARSTHVHSHVHEHGDYVHTHVHGHDPESHSHTPEATPLGWLDRHFGALGAYRFVRPLMVGIVHGLAGSAAVALLVLTTIHDPRLAVLYLAIFGIGTIVGMMIMTMVITLPFGWISPRGLRIASGAISLAFGLFIAYQIGIVHGLFTGHPHWTPE